MTNKKYRVFITDHFEDYSIEQTVLGPNVHVSCLCSKDEQAFSAEVEQADAILVWHAKLTEYTFQRLKHCKLIQRYGVGFDNVEIKSARQFELPVSNVPDYGTEEVANTAIAFLLNLNRGIQEYLRRNQNHQMHWDYRPYEPLQRLSARTLGIIGLGRIGLAVAERARAFGMKIFYYDPYIDGKNVDAYFHRQEKLEELLANSDYVSLHLPLSAATQGFVDENFLLHMKRGSVLINTARGKIIKSLDLLEKALQDGLLSAVALDVLPEEPPTLLNPFLQKARNPCSELAGRILITPHSAYYSQQALLDMRRKAAENVLSALHGKELKNVVN